MWREGLNSLQVKDEVVKQNQLLKTSGKRQLINLLIRMTFLRRTLSLNLSSLSFENKMLEWQFLELKSIILVVVFCNVRILLIVFQF